LGGGLGWWAIYRHRSPLIIVGLFFGGTAVLPVFVLLAVLGQSGSPAGDPLC